MCGIAAIVDLHRDTESAGRTAAREDALVSMLDRIRYRGDPENFAERWSGPGVALGTNRLAIVDRAHGRQPQCDPSGQVQLVYNGELYGFGRLRDQLRSLGHEFRTRSDTEVVLHAYLEWGEKCVARLDGMFAFVLYDGRRRRFLAARDHVGIKPLYYAVEDGVHYFASEQKCLLEHGTRIRTVLPGTYVTETGTTRYYGLAEPTGKPLPERRAVALYRELFETAVRKQVDTDLPVAVTFSGGIDSAAVLHTAMKYHPDVTAVTIGLEGAADVEVAQRYCKEFDVPHLVAQLDRAALIDVIDDIVYGAEFFEPIDAMDTCVGYFAFLLAKENGFRLALCGEGSDEVMAGYDLFRTHPDPQDLMRYRVGNLHRTDLQRVDRSSMLNSVETRVPFMDRALLEFAYALPMSLKMREGQEKWLLRAAFADSLPDYVRLRPKVRMPDGSGMQNTLVEYAREAMATAAGPYSPHPDATRPNTGGGLDMQTPEGDFFLNKYLAAGFPMPGERFKRAGFDFSANGYFEFIS
ncbi:asparagine synthase (glutamine-hydrolyzing) [Streptomyces sp. NPDC047525]|uniref:asparagine synthase (glutamine-hydrolyzing) n=1 Tax=Streptomyces sp. NPDC047525 TaxID=3155264 RepID=UPI0033D23835